MASGFDWVPHCLKDRSFHRLYASTIDEKLESRKLPNLPLVVRGVDGSKWQVSPAQVDVTLTGTLLAVEKAKPVPFVKLAPGDTKPREIDVTVDGVPPGIGIKLSPERVKVEPAK